MAIHKQTLDEVLDLASAHFKVPREKLTPDDDFFKTLGIDSLQALDLLTRLENHFRIELPDYELQGVSDFRTLADRIQFLALSLAGSELINMLFSESVCLCGEIKS
jgi:acyl carrier protein